MLVNHHNCPLILNQFFKPLYSKDLERLRTRQRHISMISEMYHTAMLEAHRAIIAWKGGAK